MRGVVALHAPEELAKNADMSCEQVECTLSDRIRRRRTKSRDYVDAQLGDRLELNCRILEHFIHL